MRRFAFLVIGFLIVVSGLAINRADAKDTKGCDGLADYRAEMFAAGRDYLKLLDEDGIGVGRDPFTYSSDDWTSGADDLLAYNRALVEIDPPEWAAEWHQLKIELSGLSEQVFRIIAKDGVMMILGFSDQFDANEAATDAAIERIGKSCADFPAFTRDHDALDGDIDGTPVATPTN